MNSTDRTDIAVPLVRRSFVLGVINGAFINAGQRAADPNTVIPLLVLRLAGAEWAVGLAAAVQQIGRVTTQVVAARLMDSIERKRPLYVWASVVRVMALGAAAAVLLTGVGRNPLTVLVVLLSALFALMVASGVAGLAWMDITARSVPSTRRGGLMTWRRVTGLILALLISVPLVNYLLGPQSAWRFPANYGLLFVATMALSAVAWTAFSLVKEPPPHAAHHRLTVAQHFARGVRIYRRDPAYRRLLRVRVLTSIAASVPVFFIAFAHKGLGLGEHWAGIFLTIQLVSEMIGAVIFGRVSDRLGNRKVVAASAWVGCLTFTAAALATLPAVGGGVALISLAFCGLGLLLSGRMTGELNYMLDIAPAAKRPSYIGFGNAFLIPLSLLPILVGWLAPRTGYGLLFGAAAIFSAGAVLAATKLGEPRDGLMNGEGDGGIHHRDTENTENGKGNGEAGGRRRQRQGQPKEDDCGLR